MLIGEVIIMMSLKLDHILIKYEEQRYLGQFESEICDSWQYDSTRLLHDMNVTFLLPWQHRGFQTSLIIMAGHF